MSFTLQVDAAAWRRHQDAVRAGLPDLVPVVKGNGYGFGLARLAAEAARLDAVAVAVGLAREVDAVRAAYDGPVLVLTPWSPATDAVPQDPSVVHTVAHLDALRAVGAAGTRPAVVVEVQTSMRRHGLTTADLAQVAPLLGAVDLRGWALHLPLAGSHLGEARQLLGLLRRLALPVPALWVSHLAPADVARLAATGVRVLPRVGTRLWLGDRSAFHAQGTVLDVKPLTRGDRYGYRQRHAARAASLLTVSGGTTHGVGLEAPKPVGTPLARAKVLALGALAATGRTRSPFTVAGRQPWFAEPPHMQVSMLLLPADVPPPALGSEVRCEVRMTTASFDAVLLD